MVIKMFDKSEMILSVLKSYESLADEISIGDYTNVDFSPTDTINGSFDKNGDNRQRLVEIILTIRQELFRENIIKRLFIAEVEACRYNSYSGFSSALTKLTAMLWKYNDDARYNEYIEKAKKANFDCECGFEVQKGAYSYSLGLNFIKDMSFADCLNYIYFDLHDTQNICKYLDLYEHDFKDDINKLEDIKFLNKCLKREEHNYRYYQLKLEAVLCNASDWNAASSYSDLIGSIITQNISAAYNYFEQALPYLFRIDEWQECGLGRNYIEFAALFIFEMPQYRDLLWDKWKSHIALHIDDNSDMGKKCRRAYGFMSNT